MSQANIQDAKCVLVVGATAGIGRALALAIHGLPSEPVVIVAGRRQDRLDELTNRSERIKGVRVDLTSGRETLRAFVEDTVSKYPDVSRMYSAYLALSAYHRCSLTAVRCSHPIFGDTTYF